jgi:hypothetical protein
MAPFWMLVVMHPSQWGSVALPEILIGWAASLELPRNIRGSWKCVIAGAFGDKWLGHCFVTLSAIAGLTQKRPSPKPERTDFL